MMAGLAAEHGEVKTVMIDATYLKAHRTATNMAAKKGAAGVAQQPPKKSTGCSKIAAKTPTGFEKR